jgi:hypothetical protein
MIASRALLLVVVLAASPAHGSAVAPAVGLEELAKQADLVCKATVVSERVVEDPWFDKMPGFETREAELRVVTIVKGTKQQVVRFRHYAPVKNPGVGLSYSPQNYELVVGNSYIVFAKQAGTTYRQWSKDHTVKPDEGALRVADASPRPAKTATELVWAELTAMLASTTGDDVVEAIAQLDAMSGGGMSKLKDFDRRTTLDAIRPRIAHNTPTVAAAAMRAFGNDSPYLDDDQADFWFAGFGHGYIAGLTGRKVTATPQAATAVKELLAVANSKAPPESRALAIRVLARTRAAPAAKVSAWANDPDPNVRRAAMLASAELPDRSAISTGASDRDAGVRRTAALAIGFTQDPKLIATLDTLLKDSSSKARAAAALSLLSFPLDQSRAVMAANLKSDFRPLFVNALARVDPQPYLAILGEVIEKRLVPNDWWGGAIPAGDSWSILFGYVRARPASELSAGKFDASLDALERMEWFSSSEPRDLYALYLRRGLTARAKRFRTATKKALSYDIDYYFDMADKDPSAYVP